MDTPHPDHATDDGPPAADDILLGRGLSEAILDTSGALIVVLDAEGTVVLFNQACERTTGLSAFEVLGKPLWDKLIPEEGRPGVMETFAQLKRGDFPNEHENHWLTRDGGRRLVAWSNTALTASDGSVSYVVGTGLDVTERARAEHELRGALDVSGRRERELVALVAAAEAVLRHHDFTACARTIFDIARDLIGARSGYVALLSEDGSENEVLFLEAGGVPCSVDPELAMPIRGLRAESYRTLEVVIENDFGASEWMRFMPGGHAPLHNVLFAPLVLEGKALGLMGLANKPADFTDDDVRVAGALGELAAIGLRNSRTFERLEANERRFRTVADSATDAILCVDSAGHIVYWNDAACDIFGHRTEEIVGAPLTRLMPERYADRHRGVLENMGNTVASEMAGRTVEVMGLRADGTEVPLELSLAAWRIGDNMYYTAIARDITERKNTEAELREAYEEEHRIALTLQESLLPSIPEIPGVRAAVVYESAYEAEQVGGDFYDVFPLPDGLVAVLIGDVAGKGVKAAGLTETVRSSARALAHVDPSPAWVLESVNRSLLDRLPSDQFATALFAVVDTRTGETRFASAGHMPPVLCADGCRDVSLDTGLPLGLMPTTYTERALRLAPGEGFVLYTDGLTDARRDGVSFGEDGLRETLRRLAEEEPNAVATGLLDAVRDFATPAELRDDIAIVAVRRIES